MRDYVVARDKDIEIRYEPETDRVILIDSMTGDVMVVRGDRFREAAATIETMCHSAL